MRISCQLLVARLADGIFVFMATGNRSLATTSMAEQKATNVTWHEGSVTREERQKLLNQKGVTVWMTGLSASGKSTIACILEQMLLHKKKHAYRLDGDNVRMGLNKNLGFSAEDRAENIRRGPEALALLKEVLRLELGVADRSLAWREDGTTVWLVTGVNGAGKTKANGKVAARENRSRRKVLPDAADTLLGRAAVQVVIWGGRARLAVAATHRDRPLRPSSTLDLGGP